MLFTVALLQIAAAGAEQERNREIGLAACCEAKRLGADLALFPEEWNIGFAACPIDAPGRQRWQDAAIDENAPFFRAFVALAQELQLNIALTYLERHEPKPRNALAIIDRQGNVALTYAKVFICDFGQDELLKDEPDLDALGCDYNCSPGTEFPVCTLAGAEGRVQVGAMICADREFPEAAGRLTLHGAELVLIPNACPWTVVRDRMLRARADENLVGMAMTNYPAPLFNGRSCAYDGTLWTDGRDDVAPLVQADERPGIVLARFDITALRARRQAEAWRLDYRRRWHGP